MRVGRRSRSRRIHRRAGPPVHLLGIAALGAAALGAGGKTLELPVAEIARQLDAPGAIVALRRGGSSLAAAGGLADLDSRQAMRPGMPFYLGSISKTYTATLALELAEEGTIRLEQPLADFLPDFPNAGAIRLRQLLDHTSGIADVATWAYFRPDRDEMIRSVTRQWTRAELLRQTAALPPTFHPARGSRTATATTFFSRP